MFSKTFTYTNFNDEKVTKTFFFHLSKAELMKLAADDALVQHMEAVSRSKNKQQLIKEMENFVRLAVGVRSEDGETFVKTPEAQSIFFDSPAYDELMVEFLTTENAFVEFIKQLLPEKMQQELLKEIKKNATDPLAVPDEHKPEALDLPAWEREGRKPTQAELMAMPREEMIRAFRKHPSMADV